MTQETKQEVQPETKTETKPGFTGWLGKEANAIKDAFRLVFGPKIKDQIATVGGAAFAGMAVSEALDGDWLGALIDLAGLGACGVIRFKPGWLGMSTADQMANPPAIDIKALNDEQLKVVADQLGITLNDAANARDLALMPENQLAQAIQAKYGDLLGRAAKGQQLSKADRRVLEAIQFFSEAYRRQLATK